MKRPLVSIVCTNYNKGDWIADAIDSFLRQRTDFDYEILLIDDASTDESPLIIKKYAGKYPDKIRAFYNNKNLGITRTWIKVCKEVKGDYIARCDGDDYWIDDKKLQKQIDLLHKNKDSKWCSTDYNIITPDGETTHKSAFESGLVDRSKSYAEMLATKGFTMASTWLVDAELMKLVNSDIRTDAIDDTFNIQLELFRRTKLSYIPEPTVVYRINEGSDSRPVDIETIKMRHKRLLDTQLEFVKKYKGVEYGEILEILLRRDFEMEMLAVERLKDIYAQKDHIKQLESKVIELEDSLKSIAESRAYTTTVKLVGGMKFLASVLRKIVNRLRWIDGRRKYRQFYKTIAPTKEYLQNQTKQAEDFSYKPLISIIVPTYNTDAVFFSEMIESVRAQTYSHWQLVLVDDASPDEKVRTLSKDAAKSDSRITTKFLAKNRHIAGATNEGIKLAKGEFISLLDHDDLLHPSALFEAVAALNNNQNLDFIYTDEDKIDEKGRHVDPFLKPDWNQELLYSINYITHFTTIRSSIVRDIGGERDEYNGAQDWDLFLRATQKSTHETIYHITKILYSWRIHSASTAKSAAAKPYVVKAQERLLKDNLHARGLKYNQFSVSQNKKMPGSWNVEYEGQAHRLLHKPGQPVNYGRIKGLAMSSEEIMKYIGRESLTTRVYRGCKYEIEAKISEGIERNAK